MKWIKVEDRLPEKPKRWYGLKTYLTKQAEGFVQTMQWADGWNCYYDKDWNVYRVNEIKNVVAWIDPDDIED